MTKESIFADDFTSQPYWWEAAPPEDARDEPIPETVDVAIVGSGYCGLVAAVDLSRAGLSVAVLEAGPLGFGASSRSGGMVSSGQKLVLTGAYKSFGKQNTERVFEESQASFDYLKNLVKQEELDADYQQCGRFFGAYTAHDMKVLGRHAHLLKERTGANAYIISKDEQRREIGSDFYYGGMVVEDYGGLHPAKMNRALVRLARMSGATLISGNRVSKIEAEGKSKRVYTEKSVIQCREVIVATNGYTDKAIPYLRRRIVPVASYMIATEELSRTLMDEISPNRRMMSETRKEVAYFRPTPDGRRLLFGCRPSFRAKDDRNLAAGIHKRMCQVFPQMRDTRISHFWSGFVGMTFDSVPHMGTHRGIHYALGCNGNGVAMSNYLGHKTAQKVLGSPNARTVFDGRPFPTLPFYSGFPWIVPFASGYYHLRDTLVRPGAAVNFL